MTLEFEEFPKIPRYRRQVAVTEKIDGTNGAVVWYPAPDGGPHRTDIIATRDIIDRHGNNLGPYHLLAQSRGRFITPGRIKPKNDNYSFAQWVDDNTDELTKLGPGKHFGEWWGYGIQRGYGQARKRFSLFKVNRWADDREPRPACCDVVPLIGYVTPDLIETCINALRIGGSLAAPGYMRPEGVIIWHSQSKQYYKILLENDETPKSLQEGKQLSPTVG